MRISFDIDDTLVCDPSVPTEQCVPWWARTLFTEPLRLGTRGLMRTLQAERHELWIYTTSFRSPWYLRTWFACLGVRLGGVVNQARHEREVGRQGPSKFPPAFGIDLHVDDSEGVGIEGQQHQFRVVVVSPTDRDWVEKVLEASGRR